MTTYTEYADNQSRINVSKFAITSLTIDEVEAVSAFYQSAERRRPDRAFFGVCESVRNGAEMRAFSICLNRRIIGTDISPTVLNVPDGFLCDFSRCPDSWLGKADFMYSNSYDHAQDIDAVLGHWRDLLAGEGLLFLIHTPTMKNRAMPTARACR